MRIREQYERVNTGLHLMQSNFENERFKGAITAAGGIIRILLPDNTQGEQWEKSILDPDAVVGTPLSIDSRFHPELNSILATSTVNSRRKAAYRLFSVDGAPFDAHFYHLTGDVTDDNLLECTMFTYNWQDGDDYEDYPVGIDFVLNRTMDTLYLVVNDDEDVNYMAFFDQLTDGQQQLLARLDGASALSTHPQPQKENLHTLLTETLS